ncbi:MAG TPA: hypothetical protein VMS02_07725 [Solirubrobacteraceae bacterium]|nr:hypothetical protein [Solirubrobacteraceae bacterium]
MIGLGAALVVFFAGATAAVAAGQTPPTALWAAGGAISGALIGLLVPPPGAKASHEALAATLDDVATKADARAVENVAAPPVAESARVAAGEARKEASALRVTAAQMPETRSAVQVLLVVFLLLLGLAVFLAAGAIEPPPAFVEPLKTITAAVMTLASAAGTALIGILSPSPSKGA